MRIKKSFMLWAILSVLIAGWIATEFLKSHNEKNGGIIQKNRVPAKNVKNNSPISVKQKSVSSVKQKPVSESKIDLSKPLYDLWVLSSHAAYKKYIEEAYAGSTDAQFYISVIMEKCSGTPKDEEQIKKIEDRGDVSGKFVSYLKKTYQECKGIYDILGNVDPENERKVWLEMAASGGHVLAKLQYLQNYSATPPKQDELLPLLYSALEQSRGNPILQEKAYGEALMFYRAYIEIEPLATKDIHVDAGHYRRGKNSMAWDYLICSYSFECEIKKFLRLHEKYFYEYEID